MYEISAILDLADLKCLLLSCQRKTLRFADCAPANWPGLLFSKSPKAAAEHGGTHTAGTQAVKKEPESKFKTIKEIESSVIVSTRTTADLLS